MFEELVEAKIQEAMRKGEFDNLPFGKPIDLSYWASLPQDIRAGYMLLQNAGYAPEEVYMLKDMGELRERLAGSNNPEQRAAIRKKLREMDLNYSMMIERQKRRK